MEKTRLDPLDLECEVPPQNPEVILVQSDNKYEIQLGADGDPAMDCITTTLVLNGKTVDVPLCEDQYIYATVGKNGNEIWESIETNSKAVKTILENLNNEENGTEVQMEAGCAPHDEVPSDPSDPMASAMLLGALVLSRRPRRGRKNVHSSSSHRRNTLI